MTSADGYLRTIYLLCRSTDGPAATGAIADAMGVSPASANEMVGKLADAGLATHEKYVGVALTEEGRARARAAIETYCVLERFLATVLEVAEYRAEAKEMQPVVDEVVTERLDLIVDRRPECPDCFRVEDDRCAYLAAPDEGGGSA